jgi:hypothetical protein
MQVVEIVPVLDTAIYADNDVLFVPIAVPGFQDAYATAGSRARKLVSVAILDEADQGQDIDLVFSQGDITLGTINGAVNVTDADARKILGVVSMLIADHSDLINSMMATKWGVSLILQPNTTLYLGGILRSGTPTYGASSLRIKLGFEDA